MEIPFDRLAPEILRAVIEEFVTREGTDYGDVEYSLDDKIEQVRKLLVQGKAHIVFDEASESCDIVIGKKAPAART